MRTPGCPHRLDTRDRQIIQAFTFAEMTEISSDCRGSAGCPELVVDIHGKNEFTEGTTDTSPDPRMLESVMAGDVLQGK